MPDNPNISGYVVVADWSPAGVYKGGQGASVVNYSLGTWQAVRPRRGIPPGTISGEWLRVPTKVQQTAPYVPPPPPPPGPPPAPKISITGTPPVQVNATVQNGGYAANVVVSTYYPTVQTSGGQIVKGLRGLVPNPPPTVGTTKFLREDGTWAVSGGGGGGTVTSVALAAPAEFNVTGSPVIAAGTLTLAWATESSNFVFAGPVSGPAATPAFRALVPADIGTGTPAAGKYVDGGTGAWTTLPAPGTGTVTSVDMTVPTSILSVTGNPVTTSGTLAVSLINQTANLSFMGPSSGGPAVPAFRAIVPADLSGGTPGAGKYWDGGGTGSWTTLPAPGTGTVTSVGLALPAEFTVTVSPITTSGSLTAIWANESANRVFAGPTTGGATTPTFRALVAADIPAVANTSVLINQTGHALAVGDVVRFNGTNYVKAQADSATNAEVVGIVSVVVDANNFYLLTEGNITGLSGLVAGTTYFLSPSTAGLLTATEPTTDTQVTKPLLIANTTTSGYFFNWRGFVIGSTAQAAHTFYAGPTSGSPATPTFRAIVSSDLPGGTNASNPVFNYQTFI